MCTMVKELTTTKISPDALRNLRIIAAMTGESQYEVLDRLLEIEINKLKKEEKCNYNSYANQN